MVNETTEGIAALTKATGDLEDVFDGIGRGARSFTGTLVSGLKSAVGEGRRLDGILQQAALRLSDRVLDKALSPFEDAVSGALAGIAGGAGLNLFPARLGAVIGGGRVRAFANGGVVASPTFFPLGNGIGLAGEAGAEAIMPLARGADGRLGVRTSGGSGGVSVTFNVTTPDVAGFRRSEAQITGMLARSVARGRRGM